MPPASNYATAQDPPRTMLSQIEMEQAENRMTDKFIRKSMGARSHGVTGEEYENRPEANRRIGGMDPRWASPPTRPSGGPAGPPQQAPAPQSEENHMTESFEQTEVITAALVANRIFQHPSDYIKALDDPDCALHTVAISLLSNKRVAGTDRLVYILIICLLSIALTCSLYRINKTTS